MYDPRWLRCRTPGGEVTALAFTLSRSSPSFTGAIADTDMLHILRHANGRYGSTLDYLVRTAQALQSHGMCDRESARLLALARHHRLADGDQGADRGDTAGVPICARTAARSSVVSTSSSTPGSSSSSAWEG